MKHVSRRRSNERQHLSSATPDALLAAGLVPAMCFASATDIPSLVKSFAHSAGKLGFPHYVISRVSRSRSTCTWKTALEVIGSHYPQEWVRHYQYRDYASTDPVHRAAFLQSAPYRWHDIIGMSKAERHLLEEAGEAGLSAGLSVPVHQPDGSILLFNLSGPVHSVNNAANSRMAYLISAQFNFELHRLALIRSTRAAHLLTPRQIECLTWVARGKTSAEIGEILRCSHYTVDFHIKEAMQALNISGRTAAAVHATVQGIIKP
ncbi:helix-turn-helix transcriptional regulator [Paraburkholderia silvatlantica]|uniref:LuxR family quorum-sensing system transcriptional regulator CciR n=1 Tax=Paraburkholderia silvatlantica TaxID=321895 RepID=A0A2U1A9M8_9BURK|nr:autoinducer binding domain-containing protein [Paraburkholderia silvatlantica]MBB2930578.1 LuxR family quorum-sensing system transcriptional regulator CciR [Paraburkholderia silvatlantica]PVY30380.1 LuxR family transcriptional regulator [Paraburkholderia silvatlantica]PXW36883.1 LuxR family transcriptional regulator [Paraburkholderia silvatlantica]PYE21223.1 LuxR family transcriptional regulator [Paraburkholderia silvatlantica]TDQ86636.1 LuxR family transcriptional regulator [Paraburkholder